MIPCWNEEENIKQIVETVKAYLKQNFKIMIMK